MLNPALTTKVRAMQAGLLTKEDYQELVHCETIPDVINYLKENTDYAKILENENIADIHRLEAESLFARRVIDNAEKLLYFTQDNDKKLIKAIIHQENLKSYLVLLRRLVNQDVNSNEILKHLGYSEQFSSVNFKRLADSENWNGFKEAFKDSIYYRSIETYDKLDSSNLFEVEKTMMRSYYDYLIKIVKHLDKRKSKELIKTIRISIDLLNLVWIYRAKKFYQFSENEILSYIYTGGEYINNEELVRLAHAENYEQLIRELKLIRPYSFLFDVNPEEIDHQLDKRIRRYLYKLYNEIFIVSSGINVAYSYLKLLEDEVLDIISIIEAKRYNLSLDQMQDYLIHDIKDE